MYAMVFSLPTGTTVHRLLFTIMFDFTLSETVAKSQEISASCLCELKLACMLGS